jgi:drug/metabolite transporter (DMT)-like permease
VISTEASRRRAAWALALLSLIWGYNWIAMKISLDYAVPVDSAATRFALAAVVLVPVARYLNHPLGVPRQEWRYVAFLAISLAANFVLTLTALQIGGVGKTAVLVYTMPFWVIVFARLWLKERMSALQWIAIALAFSGLLGLVDVVHLSGWLPSLLAVLAGASWAVSVVLIKSIQGRIRTHIITLTLWQMAVCALLLWLYAWLVPTPPIRWSWQFLAAMGFSAVLASALSWMLFYYALARLPAGLAGLGTLATPVIGVALAWLHFAERPAARDLLGMLLTCRSSRACAPWTGIGRSPSASFPTSSDAIRPWLRRINSCRRGRCAS